jgi:3-phenylpropionate/trans-cinnamate dioxygenase ferredoxin component
MADGVHVAAVDDIPIGEGIVIDKSVTGTADDIALLRDDDGSVWALDNLCTHDDAPLAEGWVEGGYVECPWHASKFCLKDGAVSGLPATRGTRSHRVEIRDGQVWLFPNMPA